MAIGIIWRAKQVMDKVEKQVQENMDKAAIYLVNDIVKHFGSPSAMPEGMLTPHGMRVVAGRARKILQREARKSKRAAVRKSKSQKRLNIRQIKSAKRSGKAIMRASKAMERAMKRGRW